MKIYIIAGKARYGKDTVAGMLKKIYAERNTKVINLQYSSYTKEYAKKITGWDGSEETKPRSLLQELGTDIIRNKIDSLFFVNRIIGDIKVYSYYFDVITISDARAKVEIDYPKQNFEEVIAVKIDRPNYDNGLTEEEKKHFTEIDLDDYDKFDYTIVNDGTLEDLEVKVRKMVDYYES